jgi:hypothetical protein
MWIILEGFLEGSSKQVRFFFIGSSCHFVFFEIWDVALVDLASYFSHTTPELMWGLGFGEKMVYVIRLQGNHQIHPGRTGSSEACVSAAGIAKQP